MAWCLSRVFNIFNNEDTESMTEAPRSAKLPDATAIGVVKVIIQSADIVEDRLRPPRPAVQIRIKGRPDSKATKTSEERTYSPNWLSESIYVLVYSPDDVLEFELQNIHRFRKHGVLGRAFLPLEPVIHDGSRTNLQVSLSKPESIALAGNLLCGLFYHPALPDVGEKLTFDGVLTIQLDQANGFYPARPSSPHRQMHTTVRTGNLSAIVSFGWTAPPLFTVSPAHFSDVMTAWNSRRQVICFGRDSTTLVIKLVDSDAHDDVRGHVSIPVSDLLFSDQEWWPLSGDCGGQLGLGATWTSVDFSSV